MTFSIAGLKKAKRPVGLAVVVLAEIALFVSLLDYCSGQLTKMAVAPVLVLCLIAAVGLGYLVVDSKNKPETVFLLLGIPMGVALSLFLLPDQVPDEKWHIYRAIDLRIFGGGTTVPSCMETMPTTYSAYKDALLASDAWSSTVWLERDLTGYYVHLYAVAHVVLVAFRAVGINPYVAVIAARLANGAVFIASGYWCVKKMPHAKVMFTIFMLNPMLIQQQFSLSADSVVNTVCIGFVTYLLWLKFEGHINKKNLVILAALACVASVSKIAYAPLVLLILLLVPLIGDKKTQHRIYAVVAAVIVVGCAVVIATYRTGTYQLMFELVRNPVELTRVIAKSLYEMGALWVKETFGMILGALNVTVWEPCFWLYCGILAFSAVFNLGEKYSFSRIEKVFIVVFSFCLTCMILLVFREWSVTVDKRSDIIMGLQGRYLLPFIFPALSTAVTPRASLYRENCLVFYSGCIAIVYFFSLFGIFYTFIG